MTLPIDNCPYTYQQQFQYEHVCFVVSIAEHSSIPHRTMHVYPNMSFHEYLFPHFVQPRFLGSFLFFHGNAQPKFLLNGLKVFRNALAIHRCLLSYRSN